MNDAVWVVLGFPKKIETDDYLFQLINAYSETERYFLKSTNPDENKRQTSFAVASIEDNTNPEIIGIDLAGTVYVWDLTFPNLAFKHSIQFSKCLNSAIGDIFQYKHLKRLIVACEDNYVYSFDFIGGGIQELVKLAYMPLALRAFSSLEIVVVGDRFAGDAFVYKFNPVTIQFDFFLQIKTGKFKDVLIAIELLEDNTLWIQYNYSNLFYSITDCLNDKKTCTECTQSYNFQATNKYDQKGVYGIGTNSEPFTTSANFFTAMIKVNNLKQSKKQLIFQIIYKKAQYYKELISGVSNMNVDIIVEPNLILVLQPQLLNFDFNTIISLTFKSKTEGLLASLQFLNKLQLQNYNFIGFHDIQIDFEFDNDLKQCGLNLINIPLVVLNNIRLKSLISGYRSCQQIFVQNAQLQILKYEISDEDFSLNSAIISTFNTTKVEIKNLYLKNSILGENFSIINQLTNVEVNIKTAYISENKCSDISQDSGTISSLFSAGLFTVKDVHITENTFCNKIIFSTVSSLQHSNQVFDFQDIEVNNNQFQTKTNYVFFNSLYSMKATPSHELKLERLSFNNNKLIVKYESDLQIASFIQTNKILKCTINNSKIQNHFDIQFSLIEFATEVIINDFECNNDEQYNSKIPDQISIGCLQINEVSSVKINKIRILRKKVKDNSLFTMENYLVKQGTLSITDGEFNNLILNQSKINTFANPIYVGSNYQITITIDDCHFKDNVLQGIQDSLTYSTSAIWIENYVGQAYIKNSSFDNSYSSSIYGFIFIQSFDVIIDNVTFKKSTFLTPSESGNSEMYLQNGGMMNLKVQTALIQNSKFQQATASVGAFIYIQSFGAELKVDIKNTHFEEGYAKIDGSCLFLETGGSRLLFNCIDCYLSNLYNLNSYSQAIGIDNSLKSKSKEKNSINFTGGNIINIFGLEDNYFIDVTNTQVKFEGISKIQSEEFISQSAAHLDYLKVEIQQQSTLMNLVNSIVDLISCNINNLKINNPKADFPLLVNSEQSQINFDNTSIKDCTFVKSAINSFSGSTVVFKKTKFINVNQISKQRVLDVSQDLQPSQIAYSLIIIQNGQLKVEQNSQFTNINCLNNCNGGVFQLVNSNFSIKDTSINDSQATFGGSIFIFGIKDENSLQNVQISGSKSQNDGGAVYLHSLSSDKFTLNIDGSKFLNNQSIDGKGGAIMVSSEILNSSFQFIQITNSEISENKAKIGGGIQETNISVKVQDSTKMEKNIGEIFGNDKISYPSHLEMPNLNEFLKQNPNAKVENEMIVIDHFRSGAKLENLMFQFLNDKKEQIKPITQADLSNYSISVRFNPNTVNLKSYSINSDSTIFYDKISKNFSFKELELVGNPLSSAILQFRSDQIKVLNQDTNLYEQNYSFQVKINFRNCTIGEQEADYNGQRLCSICEPGFYSYYVDTCQECPTGATCKGGFDMTTNEGYWRNNNVSSLVIKCNNLQENCAGGSYGDHICYEGHIGALCEECDIYGQYWGSSYSKSAKYQCTKCDQIKNNLWIVGLMTIWTLISMTLAIKGDIEVLREKVAIHALQKNLRRKSIIAKQQVKKRYSISQKPIQNEVSNSNSSTDDKSGIFIKMLTNYLQIVGSIATFNLSIPSGIFEFPQTIGEPLKQTMNSLDCALQELDTSIPIIYLRLIFSLFIPIIYMVLFLVGITLFTLVKKEKKFPWYILSTAIIFLIIYVQPDLVAQIIALMSCRTVGDTDYILSNVSFECYTDQHLFYILVLIAPLLLVWVFILPILLFLMLRKNKNELDQIEIKLKYGFLYREYKNYAFYWEFVKMAEKIAIILSLNFYSQSISTKAVLVFIIIMVYGILSLIIEPYQEKDVNQIDVNSTHVCALTVLLGLFIYNNPFNYFVYTSLALIVLINLWFIVKILKKIIGGYIPKIEEAVSGLLEVLSKKFPCFKRLIRTKKPKKCINPETKKKMQKIFQKYIQMEPHEKKDFIMNIIESQLAETHTHIFRQKQQPLKEKEKVKDGFDSSNKLNNKQQVQTPSSSPMFACQQPTVLVFSDNHDLVNKDLLPTQIKLDTDPTFLELKDIEVKKDNPHLLTFPEEHNHKCTLTQIKDFFKNGQESKVEMIDGDQIVIDMDTSENNTI